MKKIYYFVFFLVTFLARNIVTAQTVSNIIVTQDATIVVVNYNLESTTPCEVSLFLSADNGVTWQELLNDCTGDIGKNLVGGQKQIRWNVLASRDQLVGTEFIFKIKANGRKEFEPEMVFVEGGTFQMGSNSGQVNERPVHSVELSSFSIGKYEVTQAQWKAVMGNNPSEFKGCDNCPVENVSWNEVESFILKLNKLTGKTYRLPTEAEWEFAAIGGKKSKGFMYSGGDNVNTVAWNSNNSSEDANGVRKTHSVGRKTANELGIYEMTGNVSEWCSDWFGDYSSMNQTNPKGPSTGKYRVLRGGCWYEFSSSYYRTTGRAWLFPDSGAKSYGFRLVL